MSTVDGARADHASPERQIVCLASRSDPAVWAVTMKGPDPPFLIFRVDCSRTLLPDLSAMQLVEQFAGPSSCPTSLP